MASNSNNHKRDTTESVVIDKSTINALPLVVPKPTGIGGIAEASDLNISSILNSKGPIVNAVLLKAENDIMVVEDIQIDTTPKKQMVKEVLGGPFTFLGQYEDEGIILCIRRDQELDSLTTNKHNLQPPFHETAVKGDIVILKVAPEPEESQSAPMPTAEGEEKTEVPAAQSNDEFFLNYTKEEYLKFAARTDITMESIAENHDGTEEKEQEMSDDDEEEEDEMVEGEDDSDDDEEDGDGTGGFMELLMGQVLQRFQEENGREPDEQELQVLQAAIAQKLGGLSG